MEIQSLVGSLAASQVDLFSNKSNNINKQEETSNTTTNGMDTVSISAEGKAMYAAMLQQESGEQEQPAAQAGGGGGSVSNEDEEDSESIRNKISALQTQMAQLSDAPEDAAKAASISSQIAALTAQLSAS